MVVNFFVRSRRRRTMRRATSVSPVRQLADCLTDALKDAAIPGYIVPDGNRAGRTALRDSRKEADHVKRAVRRAIDACAVLPALRAEVLAGRVKSVCERGRSRANAGEQRLSVSRR